MTNYRIVQATDSQDLARQASETIALQIAMALDQRDRCQIALSGGSTPSKAYALLGQEKLPWDRVDVLLGDERWVSADDDSSNARMLRSTLLAAARFLFGLAKLGTCRSGVLLVVVFAVVLQEKTSELILC